MYKIEIPKKFRNGNDCYRKLVKYNFNCRKCKKEYRKIFLNVDHIIPIAVGGEFGESNIQFLCLFCHKVKTIRDLQIIALFKKMDILHKTFDKQYLSAIDKEELGILYKQFIVLMEKGKEMKAELI